MKKKKRFHESNKRASQRQLRVGEELRHALSEVFVRGGLNDPELSQVSITISEVRVSPDLANATVYVTYLGHRDFDDNLNGALQRASPYLRNQLAQKVYLRRIPNLTFKYDDSFEHASRISRLLNGSDIDQIGDKKDA